MVEVDNGVVRPEPLLDFLAGDDLVPTFNQHSQNLEWLFPQNDPALAFGPNGAQLTRLQVKFKPSKANATQQTRFRDHIKQSVDEVVSLSTRLLTSK